MELSDIAVVDGNDGGDVDGDDGGDVDADVNGDDDGGDDIENADLGL